MTLPDHNPDTSPEAQKLRDTAARLSSYLAALDGQEEKAAQWTAALEDVAIIAHHWLSRALVMKREEAALQLLQSLGPAAGFVLRTDDFAARTEKTFGAQSRLARFIRDHGAALPAEGFADLPAPELPGAVPPPPPPPAPAPEKKWWAPRTWFAKDDAEEQARRDDIQKEWQSARDAIAALQSERHYYVDSFMDWIGDRLSGRENSDAQQSYKSPQRIADLAAEDYKQHVAKMLRPVREKAKLYAQIAALLDEQRIPHFTATLPLLFPEKDTPETQQLRKIFLEDYRAASFAELALRHARDPQHKSDLFRAALNLEKDVKITGLKTPREVLDFLQRETERSDSPLDRSAYKLARQRLEANIRAGEARRRALQPRREISLRDIFNSILDNLEEALEDKSRRHAPPPVRKGPRYRH